MALSIKTTNLKREQEQSEEESGTDGQAEQERQEEKVLNSTGDPSLGMSEKGPSEGSD